MYSQISSNKRRTAALVAVFTALIVALGWAFDAQAGGSGSGVIVAVLLATVMNLAGYFAGDKMALASSGAREVERRDAPELWNLVENLSIASGLPMPRLYVIDDPALNAFATGRDPAHASVAVTTGLVGKLSRAELEGVLAHELSHVKNYDIRVMTVTVVLVGSVMLLSDWLLRGALFRRDDRDSGQAGAILMLVGIALAVLSPILAELIKLAVSREREYLADASGALMTRYPDGLASALEKIAREDQPLRQANHATAHLFIANPFDPHVTKKFERWFSTHPPIEERIQRLRTMGT